MAQAGADVILGTRYRLVRRVAAGGMGSVWEAEDTVLHRRVAVKVLSDGLAADERFVERFRREARASAGLTHPNVAAIFDYGEDQGTPYIVMELIDGETLADRLHRTGRLPVAEAIRIAQEAALALQAAHDAGIVHRDVKPANIMLTPSGDVKVMDFGIAATTWATPITATGSTMGTASYLSPEQATGRRATPASDVYALGVVVFEMLAGRPPFVGESPVAVATAHVREMPPDLRTLAPEVPPAVAAACMLALDKDPARRPSSAAAFGALLRGAGVATVPDAGPAGAVVGATLPLGKIAPQAEATSVLPVARREEPGAARWAHADAPRPPFLRWVVAGILILALLIGAVIALVHGLSGNGPGVPPTPGGSRPSASTSPSGQVIPPLVGQKRDDAERLLHSLGFTVNVVSAPGMHDIVVRTNPPAGSPLSPGSTVTLYVGGMGKDHGKGSGPGGGGD